MTLFRTCLVPAPWRALSVAPLLWGVVTVASAQALPFTQRLDQLVQSVVDRDLFTGSVLVVRDQTVLLHKGYGLANHAWRIPNTPDVRYLLASVSKQFTAAAVLRLMDRGKLKLDDPLRQHLPDTPPAWSAITIRQLLAHTAGIPNYTESNDFAQVKLRAVSPQELVASFRDKPLDFAPGTALRYSNSGYVMLGLLVEAVSGQGLTEFMQRELFDKLDMQDTGVASSERLTPRLASGHVRQRQSWQPAAWLNMSVPYAAGALYGTTGDLLKWQRGLYGGALLSAAALKEMTTPVRGDYALGLVVGQRQGKTVYSHSGGIDGFSTYLQYEPQTRTTLVALGNFQGAASQNLVNKLSAAINGAPVVLPQERQPLSVPAEALGRFEGAYMVSEQGRAWVLRRGDALWARVGQLAWVRLVPQSELVFYAPAHDAEIHFRADPAGQIVAAVVPDWSGEQLWPRVDQALPTLTAQPVYLRGSMNQWSTQHLLRRTDDGLHRVTMELPKGSHELKVASEDWRTIDLGQDDQTTPLTGQNAIGLVATGANITLTLKQPSRCEFAVDGRDVVEQRLTVNCQDRVR